MFRRRKVVVSVGMVALLAALLGDRLEWWREEEPFIRPHDIQAAVAFTPDEEINIRVYRSRQSCRRQYHHDRHGL